MRPSIAGWAGAVLLALGAARIGVAGCEDSESQQNQIGADITDKSVARDLRRYDALLTKELAWVDRRIAVLEQDAARSDGQVRAEKEADIASAREWRERLQADHDAVTHPKPGTPWVLLQRRIDRDLDDDRPLSMPRSYEIPYGI